MNVVCCQVNFVVKKVIEKGKIVVISLICIHQLGNSSNVNEAIVTKIKEVYNP